VIVEGHPVPGEFVVDAPVATFFDNAGRTIEIRIDADGDPELEIWAARRKGDLFEELTERKLRFAVDQVREREERSVSGDVTRPAGLAARAVAAVRGVGSKRRAALRVVKS